MANFRSMDTDANKNYWRFVERTSRDVAKWPDWKKGGGQSTPREQTAAPQRQPSEREARKNEQGNPAIP